MGQRAEGDGVKLSKEQREALAERLQPYSGATVHLMCDGYKVSLQVQRTGSLTYRVVTFVNGIFEGKWIGSREEYPEQKFLRKSVRHVFPKAFREKMLRILGKRRYAQEGYDKTMALYFADWASGKSAISHLCRVCESIEVIEA